MAIGLVKFIFCRHKIAAVGDVVRKKCFWKFTGKHIHQDHFVNKVAGF